MTPRSPHRRWYLPTLWAFLTSAAGCATKPSIAPAPRDAEPVFATPSASASQTPTSIWLRRPWRYEVISADTSERASVAVYVFARGGTESKGVFPWLVAAVWPDGRIITSNDLVEGGQPYFISNIPPDAAADLLKELTERAVHSGVASMLQPTPPDYATTIIQFRTPEGRVYSLGSRHELDEAAGDVVETESGAVPLKSGEDPQQAPAKDSDSSYGRFQRTWSSLKTTILRAIPKEKRPAPPDAVRFVLPDDGRY